MTPTQRDDAVDDSLAVRVVVLTAAVVVAVLLIVNFAQAADRAPDADGGVGQQADGLVVTSVVEPDVFADTVLWTLPSQQATLATVDDIPVVSLDDPAAGVLVGLRGQQGLVALALLPPGLERRPAELLISPTSTALTIAALHPDLTAADSQTHLAGLVAISRAPSFPDLVARVDGRPLSEWEADDVGALRRVVAESMPVPPVPICDGAQPRGMAITWCPESLQLQNAGTRTTVVRTAEGERCAVVPARSVAVSPMGADRIVAIVESGAIPVSSEEPLTPAPGVADGAECGDDARSSSDDPDEVVEAEGLAVWSDVAVPLARLIGAPVELEPVDASDAAFAATLAELGIGRDAPSNPFGHSTSAVRMLQLPGSAARLELLPLSGAAIERLDELAALFEVVYR